MMKLVSCGFAGGRTGDTSGFVGVEAAHRGMALLAFGWNVFDGGGEEVGGFEDLEVARPCSGLRRSWARATLTSMGPLVLWRVRGR